MSFFKSEVKSSLTPELYDRIYDDIKFWCINELTNLQPTQVDGKQVNALLNFATFDLHSLMTTEGFAYMRKMLDAVNSTQTVMIRLKGLVEDLYIKYGDTIIDELRNRIYSTEEDLYGLEFSIDKVLDVNNTFWLHPFIRRFYSELKQLK